MQNLIKEDAAAYLKYRGTAAHVGSTDSYLIVLHDRRMAAGELRDDQWSEYARLMEAEVWRQYVLTKYGHAIAAMAPDVMALWHDGDGGWAWLPEAESAALLELIREELVAIVGEEDAAAMLECDDRTTDQL